MGQAGLRAKINGSTTLSGAQKTPPLGPLNINGNLYQVQMRVFPSIDGTTSGSIVYITNSKGRIVYTAVPDGTEAGSKPILEVARKMRETGQLPPTP